MKLYDLDPIVKCFRDDLEYFKDLSLSYRIQGVVVPDRLRNIRDKVNNQIKQIEGEVK